MKNETGGSGKLQPDIEGPRGKGGGMNLAADAKLYHNKIRMDGTSIEKKHAPKIQEEKEMAKAGGDDNRGATSIEEKKQPLSLEHIFDHHFRESWVSVDRSNGGKGGDDTCHAECVQRKGGRGDRRSVVLAFNLAEGD